MEIKRNTNSSLADQLPDWLLDKAKAMSDEDSLFDRVRSQNRKSLKTIVFLLRAMFAAMVMMIIVFMFNPDPEITYPQRVQAGFLFLAFVLYIPFAYRWYMRLKYTEFGLSTHDFLMLSAERLKFWTKESWMLVPYVLLLLAGLNTTVFFIYWPAGWSVLPGVIVVNTLFIGLVFFGLWTSYRSWKRKKQPLLNELMDLISQWDEQGE